TAYDVLKDEVFPWLLPFDLWAETASAYLNHLGVARADLMRAFAPGVPLPDALATAVATAALGMTTLERKIAAGTSGRQVCGFWGFLAPPPPTWLKDMAMVRDFLARSGLVYQDLLDLLATSYVNPKGDLNIESADPKHPLTCDTSLLRITNLMP